MGEPDVAAFGMNPDRLAVRTAMREQVVHQPELGLERGNPAVVEAVDRSNPAHGRPL
jgi:hypothetical protein